MLECILSKSLFLHNLRDSCHRPQTRKKYIFMVSIWKLTVGTIFNGTLDIANSVHTRITVASCNDKIYKFCNYRVSRF